MPVAKNAHMRYNIIDACLSQRRKRYWSIEEILAAMEAQDIKAGKRTIETDLENMRHDPRLAFHAPIGYSRKTKDTTTPIQIIPSADFV